MVALRSRSIVSKTADSSDDDRRGGEQRRKEGSGERDKTQKQNELSGGGRLTRCKNTMKCKFPQQTHYCAVKCELFLVQAKSLFKPTLCFTMLLLVASVAIANHSFLPSFLPSCITLPPRYFAFFLIFKQTYTCSLAHSGALSTSGTVYL
jgi:hypothetical protein